MLLNLADTQKGRERIRTGSPAQSAIFINQICRLFFFDSKKRNRRFALADLIFALGSVFSRPKIFAQYLYVLWEN